MEAVEDIAWLADELLMTGLDDESAIEKAEEIRTGR